METKIKLIRKDSQGLKGTITNANCHAKKILPFIEVMKDHMDMLGFKTWRQGNNVHEFEASSGTKYTLRPFTRDGSYVGIRLAMRLSRSKEYRLVDIDNVLDIPRLLTTMTMLARPQLGSDTPLLKS